MFDRGEIDVCSTYNTCKTNCTCTDQCVSNHVSISLHAYEHVNDKPECSEESNLQAESGRSQGLPDQAAPCMGTQEAPPGMQSSPGKRSSAKG